ncbi:MAG TPA: class I tRNA ligase family protein [Candidatus Saccharimonadales bacterium]|nr:class I tRNA ligase family protein [Candidatus Saccharimonadales bacterium]
MSNFYITTSIPYVNGEPHLGHAMEFVMADVLARNARSQGQNVIFSTGTDEHGGKIAEKAAERNLTPKQLSDEMSLSFAKLAQSLTISNDRFIRTTDAAHEQRAQLIWKALEKDIYKGTYVGWYCTGDEEFFTETTVKANNGICPDHNRPYEKLEEENYFFKLSNYTDKVRTAIESGKFEIVPDTRRNEILGILKQGLEDISISRPKEKISWGIPVPGDKNQVMYVWFEALMNYITVLGYPEHADFKEFWPAQVQVIGKGILRFHAAIWPAMLLGLGLPLPKRLYAHGYVTVNEQKMSKSLGNAVAPAEVIEKYGADAFRYFFLRHIPSYADGDFTWDAFDRAYTNELANELGNAVQRTAAMVIKYQKGIIGDIPEGEHDVAQYNEALAQCHFDRALDDVWEQVRGLNQYIDEEKPWEIAKQGDEDHLREVLAYQASALLEIADLLTPFLPDTAAKIKAVFAEGIVRPIEGTLFPKHETTE